MSESHTADPKVSDPVLASYIGDLRHGCDLHRLLLELQMRRAAAPSPEGKANGDDIARLEQLADRLSWPQPIRADLDLAMQAIHSYAVDLRAYGELDQNAPWLTTAHMLCADHGIEPGHIHDRLNALRVKLDRAGLPPVVARDLPLERTRSIERLPAERFAEIRAIADQTVAGSTFRQLLWQIDQLEAGIARLIAEPAPDTLRVAAERVRDHACSYGAPANSLLVKREIMGQLAEALGRSITERSAVETTAPRVFTTSKKKMGMATVCELCGETFGQHIALTSGGHHSVCPTPRAAESEEASHE